MKFGGTSVADAEAMTRVVNIVRRQWESQPTGGPAAGRRRLGAVEGDRRPDSHGGLRAQRRRRRRPRRSSAELLERHITIARTLTSGPRAEDLVKALQTQFAAARRPRDRARAPERTVTPGRSRRDRRDGRAGEQPDRRRGVREQGLPAVWVDARDVLVTDAEHMAAAAGHGRDVRASANAILAPVTARRRDSGPRRVHRRHAPTA